jgi:acetyl-CoA carboxylase alpha subunit
MTHEIRNRIIRDATAEENERHRVIRDEIEQELPALKEWARVAAARHPDRIPVGTVFTAQKQEVVDAIDNYAASHSLSSRGAVVREALARLLGREIAPQ